MSTPVSAGVVPLRLTSAGWRLLVLRAYKNWDFPKGHIEAGEAPIEAAKRETEEETGLTNLEFPFGDIFRDTLPYSGGKIARYYVATTQVEKCHLPVNPLLGRPEHHEWRWVSFEEAEDLLPPRLTGVLEWVRNTVGQ
jgi:8-oxo-dGTP pyrophosphatase MutT (NUDIX family)